MVAWTSIIGGMANLKKRGIVDTNPVTYTHMRMLTHSSI
jgi:hypothetical protein